LDVDPRLLRRVKAAQVLQDVGRRIAELRAARGITQEQLAERARVDARTVQRAEAGRHITLALLIRVAEVLGAPMVALFQAPQARAPRSPGRPRALKAAEAAPARGRRRP
jgi:transcriptional regulator with XRE-family HTH domain